MDKKENFQPLWNFIYQKVSIPFPVLIKIGLNLIEKFQTDKDCLFDDITVDDILIEPDSGVVKIRQKRDNSLLSGFVLPAKILGKPYRPEDATVYTLSVILFYLFYRHHPLEGERVIDVLFSKRVRQTIYAENPEYIFADDTFKNNFPVSGKQDTPLFFDKMYPQWFKNILRDYFKNIAEDQQTALSLEKWKQIVLKLSATRVVCPNLKCKQNNFIAEEEENYCFNCNQKLSKLPRLEISTTNRQPALQSIMLTPGNYFELSNMLFQVVANPKKPGVLGLKNCNSTEVTVLNKKNKLLTVLPQKKFTLHEELYIELYNTKFTLKRIGQINAAPVKTPLKTKPISKPSTQPVSTTPDTSTNSTIIQTIQKEADSLAKPSPYNIKNSSDRFIRQDKEDVVIDTHTDLVWQDNRDSKRKFQTYEDAHRYCSTLKLGRYTNGWRLPTAEELKELFDSLDSQNTPFKYLNEKHYLSDKNDERGFISIGVFQGGVRIYPDEKQCNILCVKNIENFDKKV